MKKLMLSLATIMLVALTYQSCDLIEGLDRDRESDCDFVYPITLVMPDDELVTVNDEDEMDTAYEDWFTDNPNSREEPGFQYPLQMTNSDGESVTVNNDEELEAAFEDCYEYDKDECGDRDDCKDECGWYEKEECFDFVYPVTMTMPDGSIITGTDADSLESAIKSWYDANPNATQEPTFNYPIQITYDDGTVDTLNNDTDLRDAYEKCEDWDDWKDCFDYVYPITIVFPDNTTASANDEDAMETAIKNWYDANPNSTSKFTFSYPITITYDDGTTKTINSDTELEAAYDDCK